MSYCAMRIAREPGPVCPAIYPQAYVLRRIQHFNSQPAMAQRLGPKAAAALRAATEELLAAQAPGNELIGSAALHEQRELQLVCRHDCR